MKLLFAFIIVASSIDSSAQTAPSAEVFSSAQIHDQLAQIADSAARTGSGGATLADYKTHILKLSERTTSGGAEIHAHFDDLLVVMAGTATLITGGAIIDPHRVAEGETTGTGIRNGVTKEIAAGDVIHIPAGVPHQLLLAKGTTYSALVIKIKE